LGAHEERQGVRVCDENNDAAPWELSSAEFSGNRKSSRLQGKAIVLFAKVLEGFFMLFLFCKDKVW
jgi:hypothetical protein